MSFVHVKLKLSYFYLTNVVAHFEDLCRVSNWNFACYTIIIQNIKNNVSIFVFLDFPQCCPVAKDVNVLWKKIWSVFL